MPADVKPYLIPDPDSVKWSPWTFWDGSDWSMLPDGIDGWDTGTDIQLRRDIDVDPEQIRQTIGLPPSARIVATVSWTSSTTGMTQGVPPLELSRPGNVTLKARLPGENIGGVVRVLTTLTLSSSPGTDKPGIVALPGSVLLQDEHSVALEGAMSMFPVHAVDFSHTTLNVEASWHLETTTELTAPFLGTFRLLLNNRDTELMAAVARGTKDRRQQALCDELQHGIAMVLLELAVLLRSDLTDGSIWPHESVGDVLTRTLASTTENIHQASGALDISIFRTALAGVTRTAGNGRRFR